MEEKVIRNYKEFLDELEKGKRKVNVTEEFYEWLKENIGNSATSNLPKGPIGMVYGIQVCKVEDNNE